MPSSVTLILNGQPTRVPAGATLAATLLNLGLACRSSVSGQARAPICGMGICFECRATVDAVPHRRTCQLIVHEGMSVETTPELAI